jgi:hypothetical protein
MGPGVRRDDGRFLDSPGNQNAKTKSPDYGPGFSSRWSII